MSEMRKELEQLLKGCAIDENSEYFHRAFFILVAYHFAKWQSERIIAEIKRLKCETHIGVCEYDQGVENGRMEVLDALLKFIDSMHKEGGAE